MNFEILVTNCDECHTAPQLGNDYEQLRSRTSTESGHDVLCAKSNGLCVSNGVTINGSRLREPLMSRDPQTSSLDRFSPNCRPMYSPKPKKKSLGNRVPFFSKMKKSWSKSAHNSPVHSVVRSPAPSYAEVQDFDSYDQHDTTESNLDFGLRSNTDCWNGSNESFSDLDRGMSRLLSPSHFRARSLSCSSSSQAALSDNELSRSSECIAQLVNLTHSDVNSNGALRKSCENIYSTATKKRTLPFRSKSSGGQIMQKFSKKLSKLSLGGGGAKGSEGGSRKKKSRGSSASRLESPDRYVYVFTFDVVVFLIASYN